MVGDLLVANLDGLQQVVEPIGQFADLTVGLHFGGLTIVVGRADTGHDAGQFHQRPGQLAAEPPGDQQAGDRRDERAGQGRQDRRHQARTDVGQVAEHDETADLLAIGHDGRGGRDRLGGEQAQQVQTVRLLDARVTHEPDAGAGLGQQGAVRRLQPRVLQVRHLGDGADGAEGHRPVLGGDRVGRQGGDDRCGGREPLEFKLGLPLGVHIGGHRRGHGAGDAQRRQHETREFSVNTASAQVALSQTIHRLPAVNDLMLK